jgi:hypothetical protein
MNSKNLLITFLSLFILLSIPSAILFAYPINVGDTIVLKDGPGTTGGGEFQVWKDGIHYFNTFCVETNEYINFNIPYKVANISEYAVRGGSGGGSPDPIDEKTAYLFYNFAMGTLTDYVYGSDASADALQKAIWFIEEENGGVNNSFVTLAQNAIDTGAWKGLGPVRVMNLVDPVTGARKQDQLTLVPEPSTLLLLGGGIIGLRLLKKRFKRKD